GWAPTIDGPAPNGWRKITNYVWVRTQETSVKEDHELNLPPRYWLKADGTHVLKNADGPDIESNWVYIPYKIYHAAWRVFGGIEVRDEVEITNPAEGSTIATLPAPILLDTSDESFLRESYPGDQKIFPVQALDDNGALGVKYLNGVQVKPFAYLGVATMPMTAGVWPSGFKPAHPSGAMLANAQVKVFNNRSWDLWTQDWHCQLAPVTDWSAWVGRMNPGDVNTATGITADAVQESQKYMGAVADRLVEEHMRH
ncbi:MAG: hypothetical protein NT031_16945, partial [Planctomycetota bacterium]|nr:hypothetical protein [Planctomycetota bacterium]